MATWDDVRRIALALPETTEGSSFGNLAWKVKDKLLIWERPLRRADLEALGSDAPAGPFSASASNTSVSRSAHLAENPDVFFTTPHFDGYPAVLVRLDRIAVTDLEELILDAWLSRAPKRSVNQYLASR